MGKGRILHRVRSQKPHGIGRDESRLARIRDVGRRVSELSRANSDGIHVADHEVGGCVRLKAIWPVP